MAQAFESFSNEDTDIPILQSQWHGRWWPRSQGISIDLVLPKYDILVSGPEWLYVHQVFLCHGRSVNYQINIAVRRVPYHRYNDWILELTWNNKLQDFY